MILSGIPLRKKTPLTDVAISKYLNEIDDELKDRRKKKQGITCKLLKGAKVYKFIAEAVAMKGTSTYISETMLAKFLAKELKGAYVDTAKEIADAALLQMKNVKEKGQKLVKCGHVWVGLYKHTASLAAKAAIVDVDQPSPVSPKTTTQKSAESSGDRKRQAEVEAEAVEDVTKKPKTSIIIIEKPMSTAGVDNWKTILEKKRLQENLNKQKSLISSQTTSQQSMRAPAESQVQEKATKEEEVSQMKKSDTKASDSKASKQKEVVVSGAGKSGLQKGKSMEKKVKKI